MRNKYKRGEKMVDNVIWMCPLKHTGCNGICPIGQEAQLECYHKHRPQHLPTLL